VEQQKMTLPLIRLLSHGNGLATAARQVLASPERKQRTALLPLLAESDTLDYTRTQAAALVKAAHGELACLSPSPARTILEVMTEKVIDRDH
jgi:geranylgeranyl pyrophosphate synthase